MTGSAIAMENISDHVDLARRAQKDSEAAAQLIRLLAPKVKQVVLMAMPGHPDAEDAMSTCLAEIISALPAYRGEGPIQAWAGGVTYRVVKRYLYKNVRRQRVLTLVDEVEAVDLEDPERVTDQARVRQRVAEHLARLPEERRLTLLLRLVYEHSVDEVAQLTGVPKNTARDRIQVGMRELRRSLSRDPQLRDYLKERGLGPS